MDKEDRIRLAKGYLAILDAIREFQQIKRLDNTLAHTVRTLGAIEDTLYQYDVKEARQ